MATYFEDEQNKVIVNPRDVNKVIVQEQLNHVEVSIGGPQGIAGPTGANGINGQGVPVGGATNQVLAKVDGTNYNTQWVDQTGGDTTGDSDQVVLATQVFG